MRSIKISGLAFQLDQFSYGLLYLIYRIAHTIFYSSKCTGY